MTRDLVTLLWIIVAAVTVWGLTLAHASATIRRIEADRHREVQYWKKEAARARARAAQVSQDAAAWEAGRKRGRDDVIQVMPMIIAARDERPDPGLDEEETLAG
jgi:hypothetical protein